MLNLFNRSLTLNLLLIFYSSLKIMCSFLVLHFYTNRCSEPLDIWLYLMIANDLLYIVSIFIELIYANNNQNVIQRQLNRQNGNNDNRNYNENRNVNDIEEQNLENYNILPDLEQESIIFYGFKQFIKM